MAQSQKERRSYRLTCSPRYDPPRQYDLTRLPKLAKAGGQAWADDFARLPAEEQRAIVIRMSVERNRARARRAGWPDPVFVEAELKPLAGGGFVRADTPTAPLRFEYGGDGRTLEDALKEAKRAKNPDHVHIASLQLAQIAEKHRAELIKLGYEIVVEEPTQTDTTPEPEPVAMPKRKARTG